MKRAILIGVIVLVALIGVGVYVFLSSIDEVVKAAVEKIGSEATGTQVTLGEVEISPTSGKGALRQFRMTNPADFAEGDAFKFGEVSVTIDLATIADDPVVIKEIVVDKPAITYAIGEGTSNVEEIKKNVDDYAGSEGGSGGGSSGGGDEGPNLVIENLYMRDGTVAIVAPAFTDEELSAPLPDIHLTDIGKDDAGATPGEVASQMIDAVWASAQQAVQSVDVSALVEGAGEMAEEAQKALEDAAGGMGGSAEDVGGAAGEALEGAEEELKKLLP